MDIKTMVISFLGAAVVAAGVGAMAIKAPNITVTPSTAAVTVQPAPVTVMPGTAAPTVNVTNPGFNQPTDVAGQKFGSVASPEIPFPYLRWGGLGPIYNFEESPAATTTSGVFCSFLAPAGTSTLTLATWRPDSIAGFASTQTFDIATSSTVSGTTSPSIILAASFNTAQFWQPEASSSSLGPTQVLQSNASASGAINTFQIVSSAANPTYVNFRNATSTPGTFATFPAGSCQVQFIQM